MQSTKHNKVEFGDFQTPVWFAEKVSALLSSSGFSPRSLLEPTCGLGSLLIAALDEFQMVETAVGAEINLAYIDLLKQQINSRIDGDKIKLLHTNFFDTDWQQILKNLPDPLLIIGNPPWVTNTTLASLDSQNLPPKNNFQNHSGIEAITGSSNFDISEWMLLKMISWVQERHSAVAILCKTVVARKVLRQIWQKSNLTGSAQIHTFDAQTVFGAAVDACLFIYNSERISTSKTCQIYQDLSYDSPVMEFGFYDNQLIANMGFFEKWGHLANLGENKYKWRSGIKHDCAKVMELEKTGNSYVNKQGESYDLEEVFLYPMLKSSDIAGSRRSKTNRWMLITQRQVGENTRVIQSRAPKTWSYLQKHSDLLDGRKSSIYKGRPRFSIFGVGKYSFSPWKVVVSGLYKKLIFVVVGPYENKPTVLDDTCYFLSCRNEAEANLIATLLNSETARQFYKSFIFWDAKRPITAKILQRLDLLKLANELNLRTELEKFIEIKHESQGRQLKLLELAEL
ncbi:MAG: hypothetical protein KC421_14980 [Anaerolineales bacterium]|nr:hypothetical protein [Anaerolineales bacterium]